MSRSRPVSPAHGAYTPSFSLGLKHRAQKDPPVLLDYARLEMIAGHLCWPRRALQSILQASSACRETPARPLLWRRDPTRLGARRVNGYAPESSCWRFWGVRNPALSSTFEVRRRHSDISL